MSGPLKNPKHEKIARFLSDGMDKGDAYQRVYGGKKTSAQANACRLMGKDSGSDILDRMMELQAKSETEFVLSQQERRKFMARTVRANLKTLDLDKDGDLLTEYVVEDTRDGGTRTKVKLSDKRACVMDDAKLAGDLVENVDLTSNGEALTIPTIIFAEPAVSGRRKRAAE